MQVDDAGGQPLHDLVIPVRLDPLEILDGHVLDHVDIARQQRRDARPGAGDRAEHDALPLRLVAPVAVVALEDDAIPLGEARKLVGPGADRRRTGVEGLGLREGACPLAFLSVERHLARAVRLRRQDEDGRGFARQHRIGPRRRYHQRQRVGRRHAGDAARVDRERRRRVLHPRRAAERIDDVVGGEVGAVGELDARPQLEFPGGVVDVAPGQREARYDRLVLVLVRQPIEDVPQQRVVGGQIVKVRVHGRGLGRQPDLELLPVCRNTGGENMSSGHSAGRCHDQEDLLEARHAVILAAILRNRKALKSAKLVEKRLIEKWLIEKRSKSSKP